MKIIQLTLIALSGNFALHSAVEAQGRLSNEASQAVNLASKLSSVLTSELDKSFGNEDLAAPARRGEICAAAAKSIQFDGELVDEMLAANSALPNNNTPRYMYRDIYSARAIFISEVGLILAVHFLGIRFAGIASAKQLTLLCLALEPGGSSPTFRSEIEMQWNTPCSPCSVNRK